MRRRTLLTQFLAVNILLVAVTAFVAAVVARDQLSDATSREGLLLIVLATASAVLLNSILLRRRLMPIERLVEAMSRVDLASPGMRAAAPRKAAIEVQRLTADFNRMLTRLEEERRQSGRAVLRAQEEERARIAQDLHDEVNQALTAILLRLQATISDAPAGLQAELQETKQLATQAMEELLTLARQLRPTALDDHGLVPALASQVADFGERTGIRAEFRRSGPVPLLNDDEQLVLYRVTQESLSNVAQHSGAGRVDVELSSVGRTILRVRDDGQGFSRVPRVNGRAHLGLSGMRERALLVGGRLNIYSEPGEGTTIELTMEGR
jgi:two-component system sensor histidine kinase UhpB